MQKNIVLGSSSPYRKSLLTRLNIAFECHNPNIDESVLPQESAIDLVKRLTIMKAFSVHNDRKDENISNNALIISSDQVAVLESSILGKPHTYDKAVKQLTHFSGKKVSFFTGLCVFDQEDQSYSYALSKYHVYFRRLTVKEIHNYITIEQPLDCAGSFKCEGLGVTLFEKMEGEDPNSLIGLPLIPLCQLLRERGVNPLD